MKEIIFLFHIQISNSLQALRLYKPLTSFTNEINHNVKHKYNPASDEVDNTDEEKWSEDVKKGKLYHHHKNLVLLECQNRSASLDQIRVVVVQWKSEKSKSVHTCRRHCRLRQFTFAFIDVSCACSSDNTKLPD